MDENAAGDNVAGDNAIGDNGTVHSDEGDNVAGERAVPVTVFDVTQKENVEECKLVPMLGCAGASIANETCLEIRAHLLTCFLASEATLHYWESKNRSGSGNIFTCVYVNVKLDTA